MNRTAIFLPSIHSFEKISTKEDSHGEKYDLCRCKKCGLEGRKYDNENCVTILRKYTDKQIHLCDSDLKYCADPFVGKHIKITQCNAFGARYNNCKPNTFHTIIEPPFGYRNGDRGVYVKGVCEPVKVFFDEFVFVNHLPTKLIRTK